MTDTLTNIEFPQNDWFDVYSASGVNVGTPVRLENVGACDIYVAIQAVKPSKDHDAYSIIQRDNGLTFDAPNNASGLWVFCQGSDGKINLTVGDDAVSVDLQKTALKELSVAELTPLGQIDSIIGFIDKVARFEVNGGTASDADNMFQCISGTDPDGLASVVTNRQGKVRPGQGILTRNTTVFDTPRAGNIQQTGLISINNRAVFGYNGLDFGISTVVAGKFEIQELAITTPAGGSENATVTVNGIAYTVPLTAGTAEHNAFEIAVSLSAQDPTYTYSNNSINVIARSRLPFTPAGAFAFTSATAVGAWVEISQATDPITSFTPPGGLEC